MDKFTKKIKEKPKQEEKTKVVFENKYMKMIEKGGWTFVEESDLICVVPILMDRQQVLIRFEDIPPFTYKDGKQGHVTVISGTIEDGETPKQTLIRELEEEAGIRLRPNVVIEFFDKLYASKGNTMQVNLCILPLYNYDFDEVKIEGDGSISEEKSSTIHLSWERLEDVEPEDFVSKILFKEAIEFIGL